MMLTQIDEPIIVAGVYEKASFFPRVFLWQSQKYKVEKITLVSEIKDGSVRQRVYSVISGDVLYRLKFYLEN